MRNRVLAALYPFILAIYPIFTLHNHNIDYVTFASIIRSLILAVGLTSLLLLFFQLLFRNIQKSALSAAVVLIAFFSFGHVYLASNTWLGRPIRYSWLFLIFFLAVIAMILWIRSRKNISPRISLFLFATALISIAIPVSQIIYHGIRVSQVANNQPQTQKVGSARRHIQSAGYLPHHPRFAYKV